MHLKATSTYWGNIETNINKLFAERIVYAENWATYGITPTEIRDRCWAVMMPPEKQALVDALGDEFFSKYTDVTVRIVYRIPESGVKAYLSTALNFEVPQFMPNKWHSWSTSDHARIEDPVLSEIAAKRHAAIERIKHERSEFISHAKDIYSKVASLNQLVKIWPAAKDLLNPDTIEKLNAKPKRDKSGGQTVDPALISALQVNMLKARVAQ